MKTKLMVWAQKDCWAQRVEELVIEANETGLGEVELEFEVQFSAKSDHATSCPKAK